MKATFTRTIAASLCAASLLALPGCGSVPGLADFGAMKTGTQVSQEQMTKVVDGKTTKADVLTLLGQPNRKTTVGGQEIWYYDFNQIGQSYIGRNISETTAFEFSGKGVVTNHYKTNGTPGQSNNALLRAAGK